MKLTRVNEVKPGFRNHKRCVPKFLLYVVNVAGKGWMFIDIGRFAETWGGAPVPARATPQKWPFMQACAPLCRKKGGKSKSELRLGHSEPCPGCRGSLSALRRDKSALRGAPAPFPASRGQKRELTTDGHEWTRIRSSLSVSIREIPVRHSQATADVVKRLPPRLSARE